MNVLFTLGFALSPPESRVISAVETRRALRRPAYRGFLGAVLHGLLFLALLLAPLPLLAQPRVVTLPFRSVNSLILVDAKIDGRPVTLLVDTGANRTILNAKSFGRASLPVSQPFNQGAGIIGNALRLRVGLEIANQILFSQHVSVMNLEDLSKRFGIPFDGLLGQDILDQFRSVRIDYKTHVIELEL